MTNSEKKKKSPRGLSHVAFKGILLKATVVVQFIAHKDTYAFEKLIHVLCSHKALKAKTMF